ncbi:helix-turn-helix domain-containing protein [Anabaena azotica]|uniref:Helix-turn-helix domain-containing protein n=1 Tax=Anabaena azotica FACHB-119 TaxID=947527 RepID=A0ABR8D1E4_9NOST|nr:helix-turn-helix domain-containing protein [Anabaena azotica]MBD2500246.1 helix-turn-helix domain-containing protein [Anabaena azotica FACHB-119]
MYILDVPGNPTVAISQEELRSLSAQIEVELHRSKVYRRIVTRLETLLGAAGEQAKALCKAVGREAINLALKQFTQQHEMIAPIDQPSNNSVTNVTIIETPVLTEPPKQPPQPTSSPSDSTQAAVANQNPTAMLTQWLKPHKKPSNNELAKEMAEKERLESMVKIGQQLKQARENHNLSLGQLSIYTHIPIEQMAAVENANFALLPEDVYIRGFIRVMGNALGINGTILAASLPKLGTTTSVIPSWNQSKNNGKTLNLEIRPMHLYLGYTALVAGSVGALSWISQQANPDKLIDTDKILLPSSSSPQTPQKPKTSVKSGIKSSEIGISDGNNISPPEAF